MGMAGDGRAHENRHAILAYATQRVKSLNRLVSDHYFEKTRLPHICTRTYINEDLESVTKLKDEQPSALLS